MSSWQSELAKELRSTIKGREESGKNADALNRLLDQLPTLNEDAVMASLVTENLGLFAQLLKDGFYHDRAILEESISDT